MRAGRRSKAHVCAANEGRAKPETEKPLAMLVDIYLLAIINPINI